jgi:5-methylcytosine-specific restriction endonuclease McrA
LSRIADEATERFWTLQAVRTRDNDRCRRCFRWYGDGFDLHHVLMKSHGGSNEMGNLMLLCRPCHDHVHGNPQEAYAKGWLERGAT